MSEVIVLLSDDHKKLCAVKKLYPNATVKSFVDGPSRISLFDTEDNEQGIFTQCLSSVKYCSYMQPSKVIYDPDDDRVFFKMLYEVYLKRELAAQGKKGDKHTSYLHPLKETNKKEYGEDLRNINTIQAETILGYIATRIISKCDLVTLVHRRKGCDTLNDLVIIASLIDKCNVTQLIPFAKQMMVTYLYHQTSKKLRWFLSKKPYDRIKDVDITQLKKDTEKIGAMFQDISTFHKNKMVKQSGGAYEKKYTANILESLENLNKLISTLPESMLKDVPLFLDNDQVEFLKNQDYPSKLQLYDDLVNIITPPPKSTALASQPTSPSVVTPEIIPDVKPKLPLASNIQTILVFDENLQNHKELKQYFPNGKFKSLKCLQSQFKTIFPDALFLPNPSQLDDLEKFLIRYYTPSSLYTVENSVLKDISDMRDTLTPSDEFMESFYQLAHMYFKEKHPTSTTNGFDDKIKVTLNTALKAINEQDENLVTIMSAYDGNNLLTQHSLITSLTNNLAKMPHPLDALDKVMSYLDIPNKQTVFDKVHDNLSNLQPAKSGKFMSTMNKSGGARFQELDALSDKIASQVDDLQQLDRIHKVKHKLYEALNQKLQEYKKTIAQPSKPLLPPPIQEPRPLQVPEYPKPKASPPPTREQQVAAVRNFRDKLNVVQDNFFKDAPTASQNFKLSAPNVNAVPPRSTTSVLASAIQVQRGGKTIPFMKKLAIAQGIVDTYTAFAESVLAQQPQLIGNIEKSLKNSVDTIAYYKSEADKERHSSEANIALLKQYHIQALKAVYLGGSSIEKRASYMFETIRNHHLKVQRKEIQYLLELIMTGASELNETKGDPDQIAEARQQLTTLTRTYETVANKLRDNTNTYFSQLETIVVKDLIGDILMQAQAVGQPDTQGKKIMETTEDMQALSQRITSMREKILSFYKLNYSMAELLFDQHFIILYIIKGLRILFNYISLFLATRVFTPIYEQAVYDNKANPPALTKYLLIFLGFDLAFNAFLVVALTLLWFIFKTAENTFPVDKFLFTKYGYDYAISMVIIIILSWLISRIITEKKYFKYKYEGTRAIRAFEKMVFNVGVIINLLPFFWLV